MTIIRKILQFRNREEPHVFTCTSSQFLNCSILQIIFISCDKTK